MRLWSQSTWSGCARMTNMGTRWVVLQHVAWEGSGVIARVAQQYGYDVDIRRLDRGEDLPDAEGVDGLVLMGGPMGAYEEVRYPFLRQECDLLEAVARRGDPVLGVCLGAQLLARALGAKVFRGDEAEIGFGEIELTPAGEEDPLFAGESHILPVFHWHGDTFTLPEGAALLASSAMYLHQAFRFGSMAYGFQFHVEPDSETWAAWRDHLPKGLVDESEGKKKAIEMVGDRIIARFFEKVQSKD